MVQFVDTDSILLDEETLDEPPDTPNLLLLHSPEITLKGRNQRAFKTLLTRNTRRRLRALGADWRVRATHGRVHVDVSDNRVSVEDALDALEEVSGIEDLAGVYWLPSGLTGQRHGFPDWSIVEDAAVRVAATVYRPESTFAVSVKRVDKRLFMKSPEIGRRLGAAIVERTLWKKVNLSAPTCTVKVDIHGDGIYVYAARRKGVGGLPVGSSGRVLALLSRGIDAPVASFLMAKRGCHVDHVHMTTQFEAEEDYAESAVARLARRLSRYLLDTRLFLLPDARIRGALADSETGYETLVFRRFLMRAAEAVAARIGAGALVTGDSLGQSAAQTLENLSSTLSGVGVPVLQPLIGQNKREIVTLARRIGTYDTSVEPMGRRRARIGERTRTRPRPEVIERMESDLVPNYDAMIEAIVGEAVCLEFDCGELVDTRVGDAAMTRPRSCDRR